VVTTPPELVGLVVAPPALTLLEVVASPPVLPPEPAAGGLPASELQPSRGKDVRATMPAKTRVRLAFMVEKLLRDAAS
jgi:hypothetical protein